jgi:hypothetical protein
VDTKFTRLLLGKDLRKLKNGKKVIDAVADQNDFDELFSLIFHHERPLVMRAADAVEKITLKHPEYLAPHKMQLLSVLKSADHKELKWHIAQLVSRVELDAAELDRVWHTLTYWALNRNESKIVRVNALQGLYDLAKRFPAFQKDLHQSMTALDREPIPSLKARLRKLWAHHRTH